MHSFKYDVFFLFFQPELFMVYLVSQQTYMSQLMTKTNKVACAPQSDQSMLCAQ